MVLGLSQKERDAVLWAALQNGKEDPIKQALARGADPNMIVPDGKQPVLAWAAEQYYSSEALPRCKWLLEAGADPNKPDDKGSTSLHYATRRSHREVITWMLEKGGDALKANEHGQTPLGNVISEKNWTMVSQMLTPETLADLPRPVAGDRDTMQIFALTRSMIEQGAHPNYFKPLLEKITDVTIGVDAGYPLAHSAVSRGNTAALDALMARDDFDINVTMRGGRTLLHTALGNQNFELAQTLINKGADIMAADQNGRTPLEVAAQNGAAGLTNQIMRKTREKTGQEKIDQSVLDRSLLAAANNGHARICDILITAGANKEAVNAKGETALIVATKSAHIETVKMLIVKHEVDTQKPDASGLIAYDHALEQKSKNKPEMAEYLILHQPGYEPPPPPPPPPPPVDHSRYVKASDMSVDVKEKGLTMTFNFWTQQVIYRDPEAKQGNLSIVRFDELPRQEAILEAREMLTRLGGKPPEYNGAGANKKSAGLSKPS